jgi:hypothetical protein
MPPQSSAVTASTSRHSRTRSRAFHTAITQGTYRSASNVAARWKGLTPDQIRTLADHGLGRAVMRSHIRTDADRLVFLEAVVDQLEALVEGSFPDSEIALDRLERNLNGLSDAPPGFLRALPMTLVARAAAALHLDLYRILGPGPMAGIELLVIDWLDARPAPDLPAVPRGAYAKFARSPIEEIRLSAIKAASRRLATP